MSDLAEKALSILERTNDGNELSPRDLKLVENAVNNFLNEKGIALFYKLYMDVLGNEYKPNWLHGIENMTVNHDGYIFWKNIEVEHYDHPYSEDSKNCLEELSKRCLHIESLDIPVSISNVIWFWDWFKCLNKNSIWLPLISRVPSAWVSGSGLALTFRNDEVHYYEKGSKVRCYSSTVEFLESLSVVSKSEAQYHQLKSAGFTIASAGQDEHNGFMFAPLKGVISLFESYCINPKYYA